MHTAKITAYTVVGLSSCISYHPCNDRHCFNSDDAFDRKVRLVGEASCEVVRAYLVRRYEGVSDEELGPLIQEVELSGSDPRVRRAKSKKLNGSPYVVGDQEVVTRRLSVAERHDEHVSAL